MKKKIALADLKKFSTVYISKSLLIFIIKGFWAIVFIFIVISSTFWPIFPPVFFRCLSNSGKKVFYCLNFWDEACWFLSLRVFGLLSSSLLLFPQRFGWYFLRPSLGVCRTREKKKFSTVFAKVFDTNNPFVMNGIVVIDDFCIANKQVCYYTLKIYKYLQSRIKITFKFIIVAYFCDLLLLFCIQEPFSYSGKSTEKDIETRLTKAWTAINRLSTIWKSDLTDKMKRSFFQAAVTSILLYGCTTWTLTKRLEKKLDGNYTRMLRAILNKSWQQHPTRHQLYGHLPPITKTIQVRRTRHAGHCWRSRDELIRDVLLWIPTHGRAKAGWPARTYIQQLCEDTGCCPEDLPRAMNDREEWRERVRDIRAASTRWWWWWWWYNFRKGDYLQ